MLLLCRHSLALFDLRYRKEYFQRVGVLIDIFIAVICEE